MLNSAAILSVTAFCSSCDVDGVYFAAAEAFGRAVAENGWTLVYGGNNQGPMGAMARGARAAGGRIVGVTPPESGISQQIQATVAITLAGVGFAD